mmetsp:Transcript_60407/g.160649  ORF Transcript_60407/g.160649 Transcript_60407/m.160649 type:complete len:230 (-) Transcript_60407:660-1349(-)
MKRENTIVDEVASSSRHHQHSHTCEPVHDRPTSVERSLFSDVRKSVNLLNSASLRSQMSRMRFISSAMLPRLVCTSCCPWWMTFSLFFCSCSTDSKPRLNPLLFSRRQPITNSSISIRLLPSTSITPKKSRASLTSISSSLKIPRTLPSTSRTAFSNSSSVIDPSQSPSISLKSLCSSRSRCLACRISICTMRSWSLLAVSMDSLTKIPVMMFSTPMSMSAMYTTKKTA